MAGPAGQPNIVDRPYKEINVKLKENIEIINQGTKAEKLRVYAETQYEEMQAKIGGTKTTVFYSIHSFSSD
jgi:phosphotransacetylase